MPDLSALFAFWSPEGGFNWNLIASYAVAMALAKGFFPKVMKKVEALLLTLINKIPFFAGTDLDERFFEAVHKHLATKVLAKMPEARAIKLKYMSAIDEALRNREGDKVEALTSQMRSALERLTKDIKTDFFAEGEQLLWKKLVEKYGDKARAGKWVYDKIKALVEELKAPDHPSVSALISKYLVGAGTALGKDS